MRDYEELVKKLRDCRNMAVFSEFWWDITTEAADAIEEMSKPKWISVDERLPEENGRYLVRYKRDIMLENTECNDDEVRIMRFFVDDGWRFPVICNEDVRRCIKTETVTHWMELTEPPKEG